jgi:hypothetical protein
LPEAIFPNGGPLLAPGRLLLADNTLGRIWAIDITAGTETPWLDHRTLDPVPGRSEAGASGLKRRGDDVLVSTSATRHLLRVRLAGAGQGGPPHRRPRHAGGFQTRRLGGASPPARPRWQGP